MKKIILFFSLLGVLLVTSSWNEITQQKQVKKAIDIVENANWENEKVDMERYADYQFQFRSKNSNGSDDKMASYLLWFNLNDENIEIVTESDKYMKLTKQDSADLYVILTGDTLIK